MVCVLKKLALNASINEAAAMNMRDKVSTVIFTFLHDRKKTLQWEEASS